MPSPPAEVDPFELPDWLAQEQVLWQATDEPGHRLTAATIHGEVVAAGASPRDIAAKLESMGPRAEKAVVQRSVAPSRAATVGRALSSIARDAVATFSAGPGRVRHCAAGNCALIFLDTSRPHSRRWCSMRRCGNRTKVRIHRSRGKEVV